MHAFERILWRVARGNIFFRFSPIEEPIRDSITKADVEKDVFLVMFQGQRLQEKITKVCETFGCHVFSVPQDSEERAVMRRNVSERKSDLKVVLDRTRDHTLRVLTRIVSHLDEWKETILKEKAIYHTMNLFNYDVGRKCLMAEAWCPKVHFTTASTLLLIQRIAGALCGRSQWMADLFLVGCNRGNSISHAQSNG